MHCSPRHKSLWAGALKLLNNIFFSLGLVVTLRLPLGGVEFESLYLRIFVIIKLQYYIIIIHILQLIKEVVWLGGRSAPKQSGAREFEALWQRFFGIVKNIRFYNYLDPTTDRKSHLAEW